MNKPLDVRDANLMYLIAMLLMITLGTGMQLLSPVWGLLGTELLVILLPAVLFLLLRKQPLAQTLRLKSPGLAPALLSLLAGAAIWLFDGWLDTALAGLFGYAPGSTPGMFPRTPAQAVLLFVALAIAPAICEETLFRGVILRGYAGRGPRVAIAMTTLLFVAFHMRFQGFLALVPVSLVLTYTVWRTDSLVSGMLIHFANNAMAAVYLIWASLRPDSVPEMQSWAFALGGLCVALAALAGVIALRRPRPAVVQPQRSWLGRSWPAVLAGGMIVVFMGLEALMGFAPQVLAFGLPVQLAEPAWEQPMSLSYEVRSPLEARVIGTVDCQITPNAETFDLSCRRTQEAFNERAGQSQYMSDAIQSEWTVQWRRANLSLLEAQSETLFTSTGQTVTYSLGMAPPVTTTLQMDVQSFEGEAEQLDVPTTGMLNEEWPWRLMALPFGLGYNRRAELAWPQLYDAAAEESLPKLEKTYVSIMGSQPLSTPAGNYIAWTVQMGENRTAWYDVEAPHTLLQLDDGMSSIVLTKAELP